MNKKVTTLNQDLTKVEGRRDFKDFKDVKVFMMMGSPFNLHSSFLLSSLRRLCRRNNLCLKRVAQHRGLGYSTFNTTLSLYYFLNFFYNYSVRKRTLFVNIQLQYQEIYM